MSARFCAQCGTPAVPDAKFCTQCGSALAAGAPTTAGTPWRFSPAGAAVLGGLVTAGLTIWALILSPAPPPPGPGGPAPRPAQTASAATPGGELPEGHPKVPMELPAEVKQFIADLQAKAKQSPNDLESWTKLAQVTARAAQLDPTYSQEAVAAFQRVLQLDANRPEALQGLANVHYDRNEPKEAIPYYERYLALRPDDASARTDLGTMYLYAGDETKAVATYRDVIRRNPSFLQAHYNLGVTLHRQGDQQGARAELETARGLAGDDAVRKQIDEMLAALGGPPARGDRAMANAAGAAPASPFQQKVEEGVRGHPILGPRVVRVVWSGPGDGRVLVQNFPMEGMPPAVREKFRTRLAEQLRAAQTDGPIPGPVRLEIADVASGHVMETVTP